MIKKCESQFAHLKWVSGPDFGIYNAMNKGIRMASGDYIQILNSGDCLALDDVMTVCRQDGSRYVSGVAEECGKYD